MRAPHSSFALLAALLLVAGCASPSAMTTATTPTTVPDQYDDGGKNQLDVPVLPREAPATGERTLLAAPEWRLGEYWTYAIDDHFTGKKIESTRVVAGTNNDDYLVGFPAEDFSNDVLIFHIPGVGDVAKADLSFEVHDVLYTPLKFPLVPGTTWETAFEGRVATAMVESADGVNATITVQGTGTNITMVYDAEMGEVKSLVFPGYISYEVTKHGYDYRAPGGGPTTIRVPHSHDLIFFHGRVAGVLDPALDPMTTVSEDVEVPEGYDRAAFTIIVGDPGLAPQTLPAAAGYFDEKATAPDGTVYQLTATPADPALKLEFFGAEKPAGVWTLEHTAGGAGFAFIEGIGYHSIDVALPSGCVVASFNAQHHVAPCKVDSAADAPTTQATMATSSTSTTAPA